MIRALIALALLAGCDFNARVETALRSGDVVAKFVPPEQFFRTVAIPPYSTDPAACDRLVEEMARRGWKHRVDIEAPSDRGSPPVWAYFFREHGTGHRMIGLENGYGATRPDAVTAAALLALRGAR